MAALYIVIAGRLSSVVRCVDNTRWYNAKVQQEAVIAVAILDLVLCIFSMEINTIHWQVTLTEH